ncbi:MAG: class I SAM-dependent methyltransferase [Planctomycetes bacterium]|nr:class I SAM-dependent methyltransferase [Planctomycetota bacterium]
MADALFTFIASVQGSEPWGSVLDAGTGAHSLEWVAGLATSRWTAVTADASAAERLRKDFAARMRPADRIIAGNWGDPLFLHADVHDVVLADYLLGAVDGFAPYLQDRLFGRLRPLVGQRLYVVGLEPYPGEAPHPWGQVILEIARLRDACILLAGHRTYREYPLDWTVRSLEESGYSVEEAKAFPIRYGPRFVNGQLDVCRSKLRYLCDRSLAKELERAIEDLRGRALALHEVHRGALFGEDYVVDARPRAG